MAKETIPSEKLKISFDIPQKLLSDMDDERKKLAQSRSNWITIAIMERLTKERKRENEEKK